MPVETEDRSFSSGEAYLHAVSSGCLTVPDLEAFCDELERPEFGGQAKVFFLANRDVEYPAELRRWLRTAQMPYRAIAGVGAGPLVRAMINLMSRMAPQDGRFRMFETEAEALVWLEAQ